MKKYNVYEIPSRYYYGGISLVAAENAEEANAIIKDFKNNDINNLDDSKGYEYISEAYKLDDIYAEKKGILYKGIYYR